MDWSDKLDDIGKEIPAAAGDTDVFHRSNNINPGKSFKLKCERLEDRRVLTTFQFPADGTIDDIVAAANADVAGAPHVIELSTDATAAGELVLTNSTTINGNGAWLTGTGSDRVLQFNDGNDATSTANAINNLTISGGNAVNQAGGGILNFESLVISRSVVSGNLAQSGGGISSLSGSTELQDVTISDNTATVGGGLHIEGESDRPASLIMNGGGIIQNIAQTVGDGGGIFAGPWSTLQLNSSNVTGNVSSGTGGGIFSQGPGTTRLTLNNMDISNNQAYSSGGGLVVGSGVVMSMYGGDISYNSNSSANDTNGSGVMGLSGSQITIQDVEMRRNSSSISASYGRGAALEVSGSTVTVRRSTISRSRGGGVRASQSTVTIEDSWITSNTTEFRGGGIRLEASTANIERTTVSNNGAYAGGGGIFTSGSNTNLNNVTLSGNSSNTISGIWKTSGSLDINFSTLTSHTSFDDSGSVVIQPGGNTRIRNSIISGNNRFSDDDSAVDLLGAAVVEFSLFEDAPSLVDGVNGNVVGVSTRLGPLVTGGGNGVPIHRLSPGALGIGAADPAAIEPLDGRGMSRPGPDGVRDMGAHESDATETPRCDFDMDGECAGEDIDALQVDAIAGDNTILYDLNGDGMVDVDDRDQWLLEAGTLAGLAETGFLPGDFNLDGFVDVADFNVWNENKFEASAAWTDGNVFLDAFIDVSDLNIWNENKFTASSLSTSPSVPVDSEEPIDYRSTNSDGSDVGVGIEKTGETQVDLTYKIKPIADNRTRVAELAKVDSAFIEWGSLISDW